MNPLQPRPDSTVLFNTEGIERFFENLAGAPIELDGPAVSQSNGVTHLAYRVP